MPVLLVCLVQTLLLQRNLRLKKTTTSLELINRAPSIIPSTHRACKTVGQKIKDLTTLKEMLKKLETLYSYLNEEWVLVPENNSRCIQLKKANFPKSSVEALINTEESALRTTATSPGLLLAEASYLNKARLCKMEATRMASTGKPSSLQQMEASSLILQGRSLDLVRLISRRSRIQSIRLIICFFIGKFQVIKNENSIIILTKNHNTSNNNRINKGNLERLHLKTHPRKFPEDLPFSLKNRKNLSSLNNKKKKQKEIITLATRSTRKLKIHINRKVPGLEAKMIKKKSRKCLKLAMILIK